MTDDLEQPSLRRHRGADLGRDLLRDRSFSRFLAWWGDYLRGRRLRDRVRLAPVRGPARGWLNQGIPRFATPRGSTLWRSIAEGIHLGSTRRGTGVNRGQRQWLGQPTRARAESALAEPLHRVPRGIRLRPGPARARAAIPPYVHVQYPRVRAAIVSTGCRQRVGDPQLGQRHRCLDCQGSAGCGSSSRAQQR